MTSRERCTISRRYPERPVLGVGALILEADRILLVERGREPLKGYWSLPGGALETGESLHHGICREVLEETGLEVEPLQMFEIFERIMRDEAGCAEYHYVLLDFTCRILQGTPAAGDDVSRVQWFARSELPGLTLTEGTFDVIERAFEGTPRPL